MTIELEDIRVNCILGDLPEERIAAQSIRVDLTLSLESSSVLSDNLSDTVDYAEVVSRVQAVLQKGCCRLLERAAALVLEEVFRTDSRIQSAHVQVTKFNSIPGLSQARVILEKTRDEAAALFAGAIPEISGTETIARGIAIQGNKVLLCRPKGGKRTYLPGGHIEFGESGREALIREMKEECGLDVKVTEFRGAVENKFLQKGSLHSEINLVYNMILPTTQVQACEDWIEFEWISLDHLKEANLLPEVFADGSKLTSNTQFEV